MSRSSDLFMFRRLGAVLALMTLALAAAVWLVPGLARAADAATDSDCSTKPAGVPDGYVCTVVYEPNGSTNGSYGEVWYLRDAGNVLHLLAFTTLTADTDVLLCARTSAPYTPSNDNQIDKCVGDTPSLVYNGPLSGLGVDGGQSLDGVAPLSQTVYWVLHINQGGKTTVGLATSAGSTPQQPPAAAAPTAALTHSCSLGGISVTLGNVAGTSPADFTVHYAGVDHAQQVEAGATTTFTVPVAEDATETVTVAAAGMTTQSDTWARNCSTTVPAEQHAINPAVSFTTGCTTGITATLSNMQVDDTTTDAVTFTITTPTGAVEQVVVGPNQITKRSYDFADGTTGTLGVEAPGLAKQTKSYAKSCTAVLGEKVTKVTKVTKTPTTAVEGAKATQLPMTGAATGAWLRAALLLLLAGCALSLAGRRPHRPRHAR